MSSNDPSFFIYAYAHTSTNWLRCVYNNVDFRSCPGQFWNAVVKLLKKNITHFSNLQTVRQKSDLNIIIRTWLPTLLIVCLAPTCDDLDCQASNFCVNGANNYDKLNPTLGNPTAWSGRGLDFKLVCTIWSLTLKRNMPHITNGTKNFNVIKNTRLNLQKLHDITRPWFGFSNELHI